MEKHHNVKLTIVIPCLNEESTIKRAVSMAYSSASKYLNKNFELIVADNGSTDGSLKIISSLKNIKLIHVPIPGYGAALHYAILSARYPFVFFADADLSYDFNDLDKFLPYINDRYDLIVGSRIKGNIAKGAMPYLNKYLGTPILTYCIRLIYGINTTDCNSGMRLVKKSFYRNLHMRNSGMEWASELIVKTALQKGKYAEVPINFSKDQRGRRSNLKRWEDGWRHLKVIILLKPLSLLILAVLFVLIGLIIIPYSIFTAIAMFLFAEFLIFSYLASKKLEAAIQMVPNKINSLIDKSPLVLIGVVITVLGFFMIFFISDAHLFTKFILFIQIILFDLWLFFIETIKTHLVNTLVSDINK